MVTGASLLDREEAGVVVRRPKAFTAPAGAWRATALFKKERRADRARTGESTTAGMAKGSAAVSALTDDRADPARDGRQPVEALRTTAGNASPRN